MGLSVLLLYFPPQRLRPGLRNGRLGASYASAVFSLETVPSASERQSAFLRAVDFGFRRGARHYAANARLVRDERISKDFSGEVFPHYLGARGHSSLGAVFPRIVSTWLVGSRRDCRGDAF